MTSKKDGIQCAKVCSARENKEEEVVMIFVAATAIRHLRKLEG